MKTTLRFTTLCLSVLLCSAALAPFGAAQAAPTGAIVNLPDFTDLVDKVGPAVVNIRTTERQSSWGRADAGRRGNAGIPAPLLRGQPQAPPRAVPRGQRGAPSRRKRKCQRGVGSGFIISATATCMTNAHVVEGADEVLVTLTDKREFKAKVLGADKRTDVAVLKIDGEQPAAPDASATRTRSASANG